MTERWFTTRPECRNDADIRDIYYEKAKALKQKRTYMTSELGRLKGELSVATSIPDRLWDSTKRVGIETGVCLSMLSPAKCLPDTATKLVMNHNRQESEIRNIKLKIVNMEARLRYLDEDIRYIDRHSEDASKRYRLGGC